MSEFKPLIAKAADGRALSVEEANRWLAAHDSATRVTQPATVADLYEVLRGREPEVRRPFGFAARAS